MTQAMTLTRRTFSLSFIVSIIIGVSSGLSGITGPFTVIWDSRSYPLLQVLHNDKLVWFSSPRASDSIITAVKEREVVEQNGGDYTIRDATVDECDKAVIQSLDVLQTKGTPIVAVTGDLCANDTFKITFQSVTTNENYSHLLFNVTVNTNYYNRLKLLYGCNVMEEFYGLGIQYTHIRLRGHRVPLFVSEQGVGRGVEPLTAVLNLLSSGAGGNHFTTYSRVPFYFTSLNRSLLIESLDYAFFNVPVNGESVTIEVNATSVHGRIITGDSPLDILQSYTSYSGRMKQLPKWFHSGAILGLQGGTDIVMDVLSSVNKTMGSLNDITAIWLQDWSGQRNISGRSDLPRTGLWWNWEVDQSHYPHWEEFIQMLLNQGIRVMTYINPLLINVTDRGTPFQHNYYDQGMSQDYFVKTSNGKVWSGYSNSCIVDLTKTQAYNWLKNMIIKNMIASNISGWMCDFGESVPLDALLYNRQSASEFHNNYSVTWGKLNAEAISDAIEQKLISPQQASEIVYFMRSGSTFSPTVTPMFWLGDQLVSWDQFDGLGSAIVGLINSGMVGFSLTHSDIGGYTAIKVHNLPFLTYIRDKELLMRWCEFSAFTVAYRSHQGTLPDDNWQFYSSTDTMKHFFRMSRIFVAWMFYRVTLLNEAASKGWPVARHMAYAFPGNEEIHHQDLKYQYMLGAELLVAPVHEKGKNSVEVFLPDNIQWLHVWTNTSYEGQNKWLEVGAPLGCPVVLYPSNSTIGKQFVKNLMNNGLMQDCGSYFN